MLEDEINGLKSEYDVADFVEKHNVPIDKSNPTYQKLYPRIKELLVEAEFNLGVYGCHEGTCDRLAKLLPEEEREKELALIAQLEDD
jgi:hypothetical protein